MPPRNARTENADACDDAKVVQDLHCSAVPGAFDGQEDAFLCKICAADLATLWSLQGQEQVKAMPLALWRKPMQRKTAKEERALGPLSSSRRAVPFRYALLKL